MPLCLQICEHCGEDDGASSQQCRAKRKNALGKSLSPSCRAPRALALRSRQERPTHESSVPSDNRHPIGRQPRTAQHNGVGIETIRAAQGG